MVQKRGAYTGVRALDVHKFVLIYVYRLCGYCRKPGQVKITSKIKNLPKYLFVSCKRTIILSGKRISGPPKRCNRPVTMDRLSIHSLYYTYTLLLYLIGIFPLSRMV